MASENDIPLGRRLLSILDSINDLIPKASTEELEDLKQKRKKLLEQIGVLIDKNLDAASQEYKRATNGLKDASKSIQDAIRGMERVAEAIKAIAQAIDLVAKLIAAA